MKRALKVEQVSKGYRLGVTDRRAVFAHWMGRLLGREQKLFWALRDLSFEVAEGEVIGVIGHNGAGKSTLLKILSQITTPTSGRVLMRGRVASLLEVGTGFHLELTGRENVFLNGAILGMSRQEVSRKFDEIVAFAQNEEFIDTPVKRYSTGMRMRLAFAVAAHLESEILIIDEVLAVGDASFQQKCIGKIGEVAGSGRTVLFVSHVTATVESLCTRGLVLNHGELVFDGTQIEALQYYAGLQGISESCLRQRHDRTGTGEVKATRVEVRTLGGEVTGSVRAGEGVEFWIHYESSFPGRLQRLLCDLTLFTPMGAPVITQSSAFYAEPLRDLPPSGIVVCRLPSVPLAEGTYRCDLALYPMLRRQHAYDELRKVAELRVISSDYFGGGKLPRLIRGDGPFLVRGEWRQEAGTPAEPAPAQA